MTVTETTTTSKLITVKQIVEVTERGGSVRRGTNLTSAYPAWEWQLFDGLGQFIGRVTHKRFRQWVLDHNGQADYTRRGLNR